MILRFTMMGRSYDTADKLPSELEVPSGAHVDDVLKMVAQLLPGDQALPDSCLVVHNGKHLGTVASHDNLALADRDDLMLIAPVAGG